MLASLSVDNDAGRYKYQCHRELYEEYEVNLKRSVCNYFSLYEIAHSLLLFIKGIRECRAFASFPVCRQAGSQ